MVDRGPAVPLNLKMLLSKGNCRLPLLDSGKLIKKSCWLREDSGIFSMIWS